MGGPTGNLHAARWTDEHDAYLRARLAEKMSMAEAAAAVNAQFGTDYSRNACIGRASRKDMDRNHAKGPLKRKAPEQKAEKSVKRRQRKPSGSAIGLAAHGVGIQFEPYVPRCVEVVPLNVPLMDLQPGDKRCRWPDGEGPYTFCGHPTLVGSYCLSHYQLSIGPGTESERAADRLPKGVAAR